MHSGQWFTTATFNLINKIGFILAFEYHLFPVYDYILPSYTLSKLFMAAQSAPVCRIRTTTWVLSLSVVSPRCMNNVCGKAVPKGVAFVTNGS